MIIFILCRCLFQVGMTFVSDTVILSDIKELNSEKIDTNSRTIIVVKPSFTCENGRFLHQPAPVWRSSLLVSEIRMRRTCNTTLFIRSNEIYQAPLVLYYANK